jgi:hypothetical protein
LPKVPPGFAMPAAAAGLGAGLILLVNPRAENFENA